MSGPEYSWLRRRLTRRHCISHRDDKDEDEEQPLLPPAESRAADSSGVAVSGLEWLRASISNLKLGTRTAELMALFSSNIPEERRLQSDPYPYDSDTRPYVNVTHSHHCIPCQQARSSPAYTRKVASLTNYLYCAGCRHEHPAILFSHSSRREESPSRLCIGHEGFYTVCPHLRFSLADIKAWRADTDQKMELRCQDATCPCTKATVTYGRGLSGSYSICIEWTATLDEATASGTFWDRYMAKIEQLHGSFPALFCPSYQVTPEGLLQPERFKLHVLFCPEERKTVSFCDFIVTCDPTPEHDQTIHSSQHIYIQRNPDDNKMPDGWVKMIDPDSYGHFDDPDTKHITWCNDRSCATTYGMIKFWALITMGQIFDRGHFRKRSERAVHVLDSNARDGYW